LSEVNSAVVRISDEAELFSEICRITTEKGGFKVAYVGSLNPDTNEVTIVASAGLALAGKRFLLNPWTLAGMGPLGRAIEERVVACDNDLADQPAIGFVRKEAVAVGARAVAALPFIRDDAVRAVMLLYADTPDAFGADEVRLLRELAGDAAFALDHIAKTRQVAYLATHDQLTGLPNRTLFLDRLAQALAAAQDKGEMLAVVLTDVERFKHVNDTFGRQAGDALLRQIAERIRKVVEDRASLARVGPDVFALISSDSVQAAGVAKLVHRLMDGVMADPFRVDGQGLHLAARAGVAFFPADGADAETLFRNAEAALRRAKAQHERVVFYTPDLNARVAQQLALESKLRHALERNEFILHYQPKVDLVTGRIVGLEALIRWQDPQAGLVPPARFISLLEETGLIMQVGHWAMQEALRTIAALRAKGLPPVRIAVNVSPIQLRQKDFVRSVEEAIAASGGEPHGLDLEITESVIMDDIEANVRKLDALRGMGVELAIDDFGTGYSSLAYIARLP
ncbi:MAG: EAL domain-containing protein, partial [Pseudomonadota bacterium]